MPELRVFVSSVQEELEDERLIVQNLIQTDPFHQQLLSRSCLRRLRLSLTIGRGRLCGMCWRKVRLYVAGAWKRSV